MERLDKNPRVGVCGQHVRLIKAMSDIDYVEEDVQRFLIPEYPDEKFQPPSLGGIASLPIVAANRFLPSHLRSTGIKVDMVGLENYVRTAFRRARQIGIKIIVFGSGRSREVEDDFSKARAEQQFVDVLQMMGSLAHGFDITVVVEPLNTEECNIINSVTEGAEAVRAAAHSNVMLLADIYHMLRENENPDAIEKAGNLIRHVHVAEEMDRTPPGFAGDDFRPFLRALKKVAYRGNYSIECRWENQLAQVGPAVTELRSQILDVD